MNLTIALSLAMWFIASILLVFTKKIDSLFGIKNKWGQKAMGLSILTVVVVYTLEWYTDPTTVMVWNLS